MTEFGERKNRGNRLHTLKNNSYLGKIILEEPYNLFNYSVLGYQTYYNSQEERDLLERLYFEGYRIGDVSSDISLVEPIMRDAHIVSLDLKANFLFILRFFKNGIISWLQTNHNRGMNCFSSLFLLRLSFNSHTHTKVHMFDDDHPRAILIKPQQQSQHHHSLVDYQVLKKRLKECKQANVDLAREISKVITFRSSSYF